MSVPTSTIQEYEIIFYPWMYWGYIELPDRKGYRAAKLLAATVDGKNGVKVSWLKLKSK